MATFCSWCGTKIGFWDVSGRDWQINNKNYYACEKCTDKILAAQKGEFTFEEIKTEETESELFNYLAGQAEPPSAKSVEERKVRQEQQKAKENARKTDPLYDDIHQIARDLRFIKNYLIVSIVLGVIAALILVANL